MIPIFVVVKAEDRLLAVLGERLLRAFGQKYRMHGEPSIMHGKDNINRDVPKWNKTARKGIVHLVLRDLDSPAGADENCPAKESDRLCQNRHPNLMLRFAVFEAESWLLADADKLASFLELRSLRVPDTVDAIENPKNFLLSQIRQSSNNPDISRGMLPQTRGTAKIGRAYNNILAEFVEKKWSPNRATKKSESLRRAFHRLRDFRLAPRN